MLSLTQQKTKFQQTSGWWYYGGLGFRDVFCKRLNRDIIETEDPQRQTNTIKRLRHFISVLV